MKYALYLGQFVKIKVFIHWTFLILIGYIIFSGISQGQNAEAIGWHILFILTIFLCVVLHEFGHALTGRRFGFNTKDIVLLPIGGVARFEKLPENPKQELAIAIAGPAVNFVIALVLYVLIQPSVHFILSLDMSSVNGSNFFVLLWLVNLILGIFNLIPAFPMDGGRILRAVLALFQSRDKATEIAAAIGKVLAVGFIFIGLFFNPFLIIIGAFIFLAGSTEASVVHSQTLLEGHTAGEIVMQDFASLDESQSLGEAAKVILDSQATQFVVKADHKVTGTISRDQIINALAIRHHETLLAVVVDKNAYTISPETPLKELYLSPKLKGNALVPVVRNDEVLGVLNLENILEFLAIKQSTFKFKNLLKRNKTI